MASSTFRPFVDKENASGEQALRSKSASVTKKALGRRILEDKKNVQGVPPPLTKKTPQEVFDYHLAPVLDTNKSAATDAPSRLRSTPSMIAAAVDDTEEKECMHIAAEELDEYEDIWPKAERPSALLDRVSKFVAHDFFGTCGGTSWGSNYVDDDLLPVAQFPLIVEETSSQKGSLQNEPISPVDTTCLPDVPLPSLDDLQLIF